MMSLSEKEQFFQRLIQTFPKTYEEQSQPDTWEDTPYLFHVLSHTDSFHIEGNPEIYGCSFFTEDWLTGCALFRCLTGKTLPKCLNDIEKPYQNADLAGFHVQIDLYAETKELRSATIGLTVYSEEDTFCLDTLITDIQELQDIFVAKTREILEI